MDHERLSLSDQPRTQAKTIIKAEVVVQRRIRRPWRPMIVARPLDWSDLSGWDFVGVGGKIVFCGHLEPQVRPIARAVRIPYTMVPGIHKRWSIGLAKDSQSETI